MVEERKELDDIILDIIKKSLKPGYLYGLSENGELYVLEAKLPAPGETAVLRMRMPKEQKNG